MAETITRFAPSPTGKLHIGNVRTALINFLLARKSDGKFLLRIDDTDLERSKNEFTIAIKRDLQWLGINWDSCFNQLSRLQKYGDIKKQLIKSGRLYPCYETPEELEVKRKFQLAGGKPPIYDRGALKLSNEQISEYDSKGRKPHYRFLVNENDIIWNDMIKGEIKYHGSNLSDPVIIRADGSMTYMLCSTVDDIDYNISHIIRGEDHVSNTAIQIQMFEALGAAIPNFGHLSLIKAKEEKISKRVGGFEIESLREILNPEPMAINSFLALIGTSKPMQIYRNIQQLIKQFDISTYSKSPTTYIPEELEQLNHKLIATLEYTDIKQYLIDNSLPQINEEFWLAVRLNLKKLPDLKQWWEICTHPKKVKITDKALLDSAIKHLPPEINSYAWQEWTRKISADTDKKGKDLFMPLRLALTGEESGPELKALLSLLSREEIIKRLS